MSLANLFHPAVAGWFAETFAEPTAAQLQAWPAIKAGRHCLIAAPTGSGKTLAAFLAAIDGLVRQGMEGTLANQTQVVYVSPLKALSNDIERNLDAPLSGIRAVLERLGLPDVGIRTWVRTGDTPPGEREKMRRRPPHIVVTTPESLYVLLGSESGRAMLATTRAVIVDEIHAMASTKRGAHLALSLERLAALTGERLQRIGLSATQTPIELVARLLAGTEEGSGVEIVDRGYQRPRDLALEVPSAPLEAVMSAEVWEQVYDRLAELIEQHRTTLIFVNTRRMVERVTRQLSDRLGDVAAHHGSLAKEQRLAAEQRLKQGTLKALVATASLELGIDIGNVDLVCQLSSPRSISAFLQRVGRSGHRIGATPKGRLFPTSRDDLVECAALLDCVRRGELDRLVLPVAPLDVLAQQIAAEVAARDWPEQELFARYRRAWPYRDLSKEDFDAVLRMLAEGFSTRRGRRGALIHRDAVHHRLKGRRGARLTALTSGGTIPDTADYQVVLEPEALVIGSVNEDFAVESLAGDIFQLGNTAYRIIRVERGIVRVEDAHGQAPTIPFWLGEAPGRSDELSTAVSRLRGEIETRLAEEETAIGWLSEIGVGPAAGRQLVEYLAAAEAALTCLPTLDTLVIERFFDEAGGMQLVIHSPHGSRLNRAWGLALRKRFCRKFNFELQAAATEDNIILSLTTAHSFDLAEVARYLHSATVRAVLTQALLDAPMFATRWRWVASVALALPRMRGGRKVPPQLARMDAEDLIAAVFPDQLACAENLVGEREIPDHPLTRQTIGDCLFEAMDLRGLEDLLRRLEAGSVKVVVRDLTEPSPMAVEVLSARPYAYLDDAPLEERRTQAVMSRRWLGVENAAELGRLDAEAIARVRAEAWPDAANPEELHDALLWLGCLTVAETTAPWSEWLAELARDRRVTRFVTPTAELWVAAERLAQFQAVWPEARHVPAIAVVDQRAWPAEEALVEILRGRMEGLGPVTGDQLAGPLGLAADDIAGPLAALESEGFLLRGRFSPDAVDDEWCERRLLARIHGYTVKRLRAEIEPVAARDFLRFLCAWQRIGEEIRLEGPDAVGLVIAQLEGFEAAAGAWETEILPARLADYQPSWLDDQSLAGRVTWLRLSPVAGSDAGARRVGGPVRTTPVTLLPRRHAALWAALTARDGAVAPGPRAQQVMDCIARHGALFFDELTEISHLLRPQVEEALGELVSLGLVSSDGFGGLRALLVPSDRRRPSGRRRISAFGMDDAGRWALRRREVVDEGRRVEAIDHAAHVLLRRYGVVFWRLLVREADRLPPWRDLLRVYRRMEARGDIRGGRFVAGFPGEQFAMPDAVGLLRQIRRQPDTGALVSLSAADPLNLVGILTPGARLPGLTGNRLLYRDGIPVATLAGGQVTFLVKLEPADEWQVQKALLRSPVPGLLADLA